LKDSLGFEESTATSTTSRNIHQELEKRMEGSGKNDFDVPHEYAPPKNLFDPTQEPKNEIGESAKKFLLEQIKSDLVF
jgi:hypothetical protein